MNTYYFAPLYDILLQPFIHKMRLKTATIANSLKVNTAIDLCCGTGHQLKYLRKAGIDAEGVDLNELMLRQTKNNQAAKHCRKGDARSTRLPKESFDAAMTTLSLHEMPQNHAKDILKEMLRLTNKQGVLLITDYDFHAKSSSLLKYAMYAIEFFVGGEHYKNFRKYLQYGQMETLTKDLPVTLLETHYFFGQTIALRVFRKQG